MTMGQWHDDSGGDSDNEDNSEDTKRSSGTASE